MIISKTPYRISFFGGGTDYPDWYLKNSGQVISVTINKYIYLTLRKLPHFFKHKFRVVWSKIETVRKIDDINHPAIKGALKKYLKKDVGLEIHYDGDLPARSGIGSSSVFAVGLLNALMHFKGFKINKIQLAKESIRFEQVYLKQTVGSQDQIAASFGGLNFINFKKNGSFEVSKVFNNKDCIEELLSNFVLVYTGVSRTANYVAKTYVKNLNYSKKNLLINIAEQTHQAKRLLINREFDSFGKLLHETWQIKKQLSNKVTNHKINEIYNEGINSGALGGKLLGAGGGGFFLFYIKKNRLHNLKRRLKKLQFISVKPSYEGSKIIFNNE